MMDKNKLDKLHFLELEIAKEIRRICDKYDIKYFLDAGSLLGCIRHKGFIPWDDDMDIGMLRNDYDKFIQYAEQELDEKYYLQTTNSDKYYGLTFAKVRLRGTKFIEEKSKNTSAETGIFVDVFPYDNMSDNAIATKINGIKLKLYSHLLMIKSGIKVWENEGIIKKMKFAPFCILSLFVTRNNMIHRIERLLKKYNNIETKNIAIGDGTYYSKWFFPKQLLTDLILGEFEDELFYIPKEYDLFLSKAYNNYMEMPPEKERRSHNALSIDFGQY